jgi:AcrR family transcriptional regulator
MSTDDRILEAALRVFLEEGPQATTRRIAQEAGVNEVTLFRRFGNKDHLLVEAIRRDASTRILPVGPGLDPAAELIAWAGQAAHGLVRIRGLLRATFEVHRASPQVCVRANDGPVRMRAELVAWLQQLQARGVARPQADVEAAAHLLLDGLFATVMRPDPTIALSPDLDEVVLRYTHLVLSAVGVAVGPPPVPELAC